MRTQVTNRAHRNTGITEGTITHQCGCTEYFRSRSAYGWSMVAGLAAGTDCYSCWSKNYSRNLEISQRLAPTLPARHLARGGALVEGTTWQTTWRLGRNNFIEPYNSDPHYIGAHAANRVLGFGWSIRMEK
jgi:hypothetical protein